MENFFMHLKLFIKNITVEPLMFMYMMAIFISYPTFQALLYRKICVRNFNQTFCDALSNFSDSEGLNHTHQIEEDFVQTETSHWILLNNVATTVPSCISVLCYLGPLVDVNHKKAILTTLSVSILQALSNLIGSIFLYIPESYLLIGSILNGLGGGFIAMMMAIYSYITIITTYRNKTYRISIVESMIFVAGFLGVFTSGLMIDKLGFIFTYSFIIGLLVLSVFYVLIRLPSSISIAGTEIKFEENEGKFCQRVFEKLSSMIKFVRKEREEKYKLYIGLMILVILILQFATSGENDVMFLYVTRAPLSWSRTLYGYFKGSENFLRGAMLLTVLPVLKFRFHLRDTSIIIIGLISKFVGFIFYSFRITEVIFTGAVMSMLMGFPSAGLRSLVSSLVDKNEHGRLFGLIASLESIASLIATLLFNEVYPASLPFFPGLCFILAAVIVCVGGCIVWWLHMNITTNTGHYGNLEVSNSTVNSESEDGVVN
ncbi:hypothetical protein LOTGIDRAFT_232543 [Lottia gigantea]|uniref:Major facilitator superfamily (MFS) profile domain-containing protein n=1 Tax=Lottia gigantea TaxID=225164 RepID=V4BYW0_LOTGI|nr:hypothetical protein LOTGIDRAFT_232543 [Lottia gigantea]ESO94309.1 hypothetical protein LOTGIDRAFT_232543 [Lottia gigantea]